MANARPATEAKQAAKRHRDEIGIPRAEPAFVVLPTIVKIQVTKKTADHSGTTANLVSEATAPDGTVIRHYS
jgi:hypothetical protein